MTTLLSRRLVGGLCGRRAVAGTAVFSLGTAGSTSSWRSSRSSGPRRASRSGRWTLTTRSSSFLRSRHIPGLRSVAGRSCCGCCRCYRFVCECSCVWMVFCVNGLLCEWSSVWMAFYVNGRFAGWSFVLRVFSVNGRFFGWSFVLMVVLLDGLLC